MNWGPVQKSGATTDIVNAFFTIPLAAGLLSFGGAFPTPGTNGPRGESTAPPFAMEKGAPEHLQYCGVKWHRNF